MKTLGNIIWFIFGGLEMALIYFIIGAVCCVTIVLIPLGLQLFKLGRFVIWPFGKRVEDVNANGFKIFMNVLWLVFGGIVTVIMLYIIGAIFCITVVGIPFGLQWFKLAKFSFMPFGHDFVKDVPAPAAQQ